MAKNTILNQMRRMQEQMDSMFDNFFSSDPFDSHLIEDSSGKGLGESNFRNPLSDIYETDKEIVAEVDIPGVEKKDIKVNVDSDGIEVKAESKNELKNEDKKEGIYRFERNYSGFYRHFSLPKNVDADKANAEYKDGVLKVTVPKLEVEKKEKKLLEIK